MFKARHAAVAGALLSLLSGSACASDDGAAAQPTACERSHADAAEQIGPTGAVPGYAPEDESTFVVKVESASDAPQRLVVEVDGDPQIDMAIPGSGGCTHPPVFTFGFDRPPGETAVEVRFGGSSASETIEVVERPTWLVVQLSASALDLSVWKSRPSFG